MREIKIYLPITDSISQWLECERFHLSMPMNPDGRVEDLVEEGRPLHVGVEVVQLLHSDHLPAVNQGSVSKIIGRIKGQSWGFESRIRIGMKVTQGPHNDQESSWHHKALCHCHMFLLNPNPEAGSSLSPVRRGILVVRDLPDLHLPLHDLGHILVHRRRVLPKEVDHLEFSYISHFCQISQKTPPLSAGPCTWQSTSDPSPFNRWVQMLLMGMIRLTF